MEMFCGRKRRVRRRSRRSRRRTRIMDGPQGRIFFFKARKRRMVEEKSLSTVHAMYYMV